MAFPRATNYRGVRGTFGLALFVLPILVSRSLAVDPTCVEQALNEFENSGPCSLGDKGCYCSEQNKALLSSDIEEACVNDASARAGATSVVQSFCHSVTGGSNPSTSSASTSQSSAVPTKSETTPKESSYPSTISTTPVSTYVSTSASSVPETTLPRITTAPGPVMISTSALGTTSSSMMQTAASNSTFTSASITPPSSSSSSSPSSLASKHGTQVLTVILGITAGIFSSILFS